MSTTRAKQLRWVKQVQVDPLPSSTAPTATSPTTRERLVAALADRPRTVAQLAQAFGLSQPTVLDHIRRAVRDGLVTETDPDNGERRSSVERYYTPTVPVIRQPDREVLHSACRPVADEFAAALRRGQADLEAAFAMTALAREGWTIHQLWPYLNESIHHLALAQAAGFARPAALPPHGLAWVEESELAEVAAEGIRATDAEREEELA